MKMFSNAVKILSAIVLLIASTSSYALPTLGFGGNLQYDTTGFFPADLNITGNVNASSGLSITPELATSSFSLFADFLFETFVAGATTTGTFGTTPILPDLLVTDNGGAGGALRTLLTGNVETLELVGPNGFNLGSMSGSVLLGTGGILNEEFGGAGTLVAFSFNLTTVFGEGMFNNSFAGIVNGAIIGVEPPSVIVPEPMPLLLLSIGLIGITLTRRIYKRG